MCDVDQENLSSNKYEEECEENCEEKVEESPKLPYYDIYRDTQASGNIQLNEGADVSLFRLSDQALMDLKNTPTWNRKNSFNCAFCLRQIIPGEHLFCGRCKLVPYCSQEHAELDWNSTQGTVHQMTCGYYQREDGPGVVGTSLIRGFITDTVGYGLFTLKGFKKDKIVLIGRPVKRRLGEELAVKEYLEQAKEKHESMMKSGEKITPDAAKEIFEKLKERNITSPIQREDITEYREKILVLKKINRPIHELELYGFPKTDIFRQKEFDMCLEMCYPNHSCRPNCYISTDGVRYYLISLRDIEEGEQLTVRYMDPYSMCLRNLFEQKYKGVLWQYYGITCPRNCLCDSQSFWSVFSNAERLFEKYEVINKIVQGGAGKTPNPRTLVNRTKKVVKELHGIYFRNSDIISPQFPRLAWSLAVNIFSALKQDKEIEITKAEILGIEKKILASP